MSDSSQQTTDAVIATTNDGQPLNGSMCGIASLEVYRGSEDVFQIQHDGFSLSDRGTLEVRIKLDSNFSQFKKSALYLFLIGQPTSISHRGN